MRDLLASLACLLLAACIWGRWGDYLSDSYGPPSYVDGHGYDVRTNGFSVDQPTVDLVVEARHGSRYSLMGVYV